MLQSLTVGLSLPQPSELTMLRISRLTDYATVILGVLAAEPERVHTATALAARTRIAAPTASKLLKQLHRAALVSSRAPRARSAPRRSWMRSRGRSP